jgi:uncharacterized protein YmfQ (DUF2313 family)
MKVLEGLSGELSRLEQRGCDLLDEVDPRTTTELIGDWERVLGLPSDCGPPPTDLVERRAAVVARLINNNPSTLETLRLIAEAWGVPATIRPRRPIQLGLWQLGEGHELGPPETRFVTTVEFGFEPVKLFRVGTSRVGESLASVNRPEGAICALEDAAPAHTKLTFTFTGPDAVSVYVLRIDRSGTGVWTIELDSGGCVPIRVGRAGGLDIPVVGGTLQVFQRGAGVVGIHLTPLGSGWTFNVTPRAGGSWSVDVGPAALQFNGGATSVLKACPIDNQIPVTLRNGSTLQAALEEL